MYTYVDMNTCNMYICMYVTGEATFALIELTVMSF